MHDDHHGAHGGHHHHDHGPGPGHNAPPRRAAQWQTPHLPHDHGRPGDETPPETDLDLVEAAFAEGFASASDPTSFLRLAGIPLVMEGKGGARLGLLRVELEQIADTGTLAPQLGGGLRYDPLPAKLVGRRRRLRFVYHDGERAVPLTFVEAKGLVAPG